MPADSSTQTILVTGATGTVGSEVLRALEDYEGRTIAAVRDPAGAAAELPQSVDPVRFDFTKPETWGFAFEDVDSLFLVRPPGETSVSDDLLPAVEAAVRSGVGHVVFLSVQGADRIPILPHRRIERRLESLPVAYTFLRAAFFLQNLLEVHREDIVNHDRITVPAGSGETVFVDVRDAGAVAARVLTEPGHRDRAYEITGPEKLDYHEVADIFSAVLERKITYSEPGITTFVRRMTSQGQDLGFVLMMLLIYAPTRFGLVGEPTDTVGRVLDRDPYTIREFVTDHRDAFEPDR